MAALKLNTSSIVGSCRASVSIMDSTLNGNLILDSLVAFAAILIGVKQIQCYQNSDIVDIHFADTICDYSRCTLYGYSSLCMQYRLNHNNKIPLRVVIVI